MAGAATDMISSFTKEQEKMVFEHDGFAIISLSLLTMNNIHIESKIRNNEITK